MRIFYADFTDRLIETEFPQLLAADIEPVLAETPCLSEDALIACAKGFDAIVCSRAPLTRRVIDHLPDLRLICAPQVGIDHIDIEAAIASGVRVGHTPMANYTEVAVHALGLALMLIRGIPAMTANVSAGGWSFNAPGILRRPGELTVGVIGLGRIGRAFAERAAPSFAAIKAYDPYVATNEWPVGVERCESRNALLQQSDIVSLHTPLTTETNGMVDDTFLSEMKPTSVLVNTARGQLVDTVALIRALDKKTLAGAALDVLPNEPPAPDDPVLSRQDIIVTPHAAFYSDGSQRDQRGMTVANIIAFKNNGAPLYPADAPSTTN